MGNPWDCQHGKTEIRRRKISGGAVRFDEQCLSCGRSLRAVKKETVRLPVAEWDESLAPAFEARIRESYDAKREADRAEWRERYNSHLASPKWKGLRQRVLARAGYICEGCGIHQAAQVHNLSYDHLGDEFLWELRAVCIECHERFHGHEFLA